MLLEELVSRLQGVKGSGAWRDIAKLAGVDYFTVARIARGTMPNPGIKTCERIADAIGRMNPPDSGSPSEVTAQSPVPAPLEPAEDSVAELHTQSEADHATCGAALHPNTPRGAGQDRRVADQREPTDVVGF